MFAALTTIGVSATGFDTAPYTYNGESGVAIIGFNGLNGGETVIIPAEINGEPVLALGIDGPLECITGADKIQGLDLTQADNLKIIEKNAFSMCYNIKGTIKSATIEKVRECAFGFCAQITSINFPACMTVEDGAFCITGLKPKQVTLAEGCSIGKGAFELTEIKDLINDINYGNPYFYTAPYEYDINHDDKISEDEKGVAITEFINVTKGQTVTIPARIGGKKVLTLGQPGAEGHIPGAESLGRLEATQATNLKVIEERAFFNCDEITSVNLSALTTVGEYAFMYCSSLKSFSAEKLETVGDDAFFNCKELTNLDLPALTTIGSSAFYGTGLTSLNLPEVTTIGSSAFHGTGLTSLNLPKVTTVESVAFQNCTKLTSLNLPEVTTIGSAAFQNCTKLKRFSAQNLTTLSYWAFEACRGLRSFSAPKLKTVEDYAFSSCTGLTNVTLKEGCSIGTNAFYSVPDNCTITYVNNEGDVVETIGVRKL